MRTLFLALPILLATAGCGTADHVAEQAANGADAAGNAMTNTAAAAVDAAGNLAEDVGNATASTVDRDAWVGRWKGVEGLNLVIAKGDAPGRYRLDMQYSLDDKGSFEGTGTREGIAFTRPDGAQVLRASDGDGTGLKYLAGKKDCLKVKDGEGYCRD